MPKWDTDGKMRQKRDRMLVFFSGRIIIDFKMFNSPFFGKSENGNWTKQQFLKPLLKL